jgi:hypothetical protein
MVDDISALGLRHVGYGIPTELIGVFVTASIEVLIEYTDDETAVQAFRWSLGLISMILVRTITEGSTIVMKAIDANSAPRLRKAVSCAPRGERAEWLLQVQVGTQSISPLFWAISSGCIEAAKAIIHDLLTIRADRERYYYGVDYLFSFHEDIVKILVDDAPALLPTLLDGLVWRCRTSDNGMRRVNYYVKHLVCAKDGGPAMTIQWLTQYNDPGTMENPVIVAVSDNMWHGLVLYRFAVRKSWYVVSLVFFLLSQSILPKLDSAETDAVRYMMFGARCYSYVIVLFRLIYTHTAKTFVAYRRRQTVKVFRCIPIPKYLTADALEKASFLLMLLLIAMLSCEPMIVCLLDNANGGWPPNAQPTEYCEGSRGVMFRYTLFSLLAMAIQYFMIVDMAVFSTALSAFKLVVQHVLAEIGRFMVALVFLLLTFGSAISVLDHDQEAMKNIAQASVALFAITVKLYQDDYRGIDEPALIVAIFLYQTASAIVLMNLLISQLQCSYDLVYQDAVGYARLTRCAVIAETIATCPRKQWDVFVQSLNFEQKLEFNEGDVGVPGGIQCYESARIHPIVGETIIRFGGSCSPELPWPEESEEKEEDNKFDRLEKLIQKVVKSMGQSGADQKGGSGSGGKGSSGDHEGRSGSKGSNAEEDEGSEGDDE